ncbi:MAG: prepilin-type N-terminal cleavage/methylation domain-containing protein [Kineosporiaceae bacterium]
MRRLRARRDDEGFTLVELLVTMVVISVALLGLMALQTKALVSGGQARARQQATSVSNQVLEQLRSLPWATLSKGMSTTYAVLGADPNVVAGRLKPAGTSIDEALRTSATQATDVAPLSGTGGTNVSTYTDPSGTGVVYTARSYVTVPSSSTGLINLTVVVTWRILSTTRTATVITRTQAYAPSGGCGSPANQPFLGACQAFFQAEAGAIGPSIDVTAASAAGEAVPAGTPVLPGATASNLHLDLGSTGASISSMQAASGEASVTPAQASIMAGGTTSSALTAAELKRLVSSDVGASASPASDSATATSAASMLTAAGTTSSLKLTPPTTQSQAVVGSTTTATCPGPTPASQPCTDGRLSGGTAASLVLGVGAVNRTLVSVAAPGSPWVARTSRFGATAGSAALGCATISGAGCVSAGASRSLGTVAFAVGPWSTTAAASGLVSVSSYSDSTLSEYGPSSLSATPSVTRTGTISYWNGSGYTNLPLTTGTNTTITPTSSGTSIPAVTWTNGSGTTLVAKATITVRQVSSVRTNPSAACTTDACQLTSDVSSVTVSVTYTLTDATGTSTFMVSTDLGSIRSVAGYKAAP